MFTQTHILLNVSLLAKKGMRSRNVAVIAGALFPDSDVLLMFIVERIKNTPGCEIFHYRYLDAPWTTIQTMVNSFPIYLTMTVIGMLMMRTIPGVGSLARYNPTGARMGRLVDFGLLLTLFSISALMHISADFLLHHEDARSQFWPLSDWVFRSPVSYWDPKYFGNHFAKFEILLGLCLAIVVWRRYSIRSVHAIVIVLCLGYVGPIYASLFGAADHDRGPSSCEMRSAIS
jgi:hypothetical protein